MAVDTCCTGGRLGGGGGEHPPATTLTGRTVVVCGMASRHPTTRAVTAIARHSNAVAATLTVTRGRRRRRLPDTPQALTCL